LSNIPKKKTSLSSLEISVLCKELNEKIRDYYVENIYHPNLLTLLLRLNKPASPTRQLVVEAGKAVYLTTYTVEKPSKPSVFCSTLRKYLLNGKIKKIEQPNFERILVFYISTSHGNFKLIVELFGKGNIILADREEKILQALTYRKMRDRWIIRGEKFKLPPTVSLNPEKIGLDELSFRLKEAEGEVVRVLSKTLGVGGTYTEEILNVAGVEKTLTSKRLTEEDIKKIYDTLRKILEKRDNPKPCIVFTDEAYLFDVLPFPLTIYNQYRHKFYSTFNEALDEYFTKIRFEEEEKKRKEKLLVQLEEQKRILEEQKLNLENLEKSKEKDRLIGDLIFRFAGELQVLVNHIHKMLKNGKNWEEIKEELNKRKVLGKPPFTYFRSINPKERVVEVSVENVDFKLNLEKSVYQNATLYYEEAKKTQEKILRLKEAMDKTLEKIKALEEGVEAFEAKHEKPKKIPEKKWFEKYRFFYSSEGFLVVSGKDAHSNEALIKRYTEPWDLVFHADLVGAPFTIIKTQGKTPDQKTIEEAAQFTACYSRAWKDGFSSVDVYYVKPEQLSKSAPSGQYLGRGSFIVIGKKNYIQNVPLKLALGVKFNEEAKVYAGPPSAIKKLTSYFVEIVPGKEEAKKVAFKLRKKIVELVSKELKDKALKIPLESFISLIPFGKAYLPED